MLSVMFWGFEHMQNIDMYVHGNDNDNDNIYSKL